MVVLNLQSPKSQLEMTKGNCIVPTANAHRSHQHLLGSANGRNIWTSITVHMSVRKGAVRRFLDSPTAVDFCDTDERFTKRMVARRQAICVHTRTATGVQGTASHAKKISTSISDEGTGALKKMKRRSNRLNPKAAIVGKDEGNLRQMNKIRKRRLQMQTKGGKPKRMTKARPLKALSRTRAIFERRSCICSKSFSRGMNDYENLRRPSQNSLAVRNIGKTRTIYYFLYS